MQLSNKRMLFRKNQFKTNPNRALFLFCLVVASTFVLRGIGQKEIVSPFELTPTPTRTSSSFALEGQTHFMSGDLNTAIESYQMALEEDPENVQLWSELARIQAYSTKLLTTDESQLNRLMEAKASIDRALEINSENSTAWAIQSFILDWLGVDSLTGDEAESYLTQAEQSAARALQLDNQNTLALAYYAEILVDQQKWLQAQQYAEQAVESDPGLMDAHRIYAYVLETLQSYSEAIQEYKKAIEINPNLTFLYINIGLNYRVLEQYELALEYFAQAAAINDNLGVKDPIPYIAIGKTYSQMGEFYAASTNMLKALQYSPTRPDVYGQLGIVYLKSRNYEGSIEALKCAVQGCTAEESCAVRFCDSDTAEAIEIEGMPLSGTTVVYYYSYGSVLAAMHRPYEDKCTEALQVMAEVKEAFGSEAIVSSIVESSEEICASFGYYYP